MTFARLILQDGRAAALSVRCYAKRRSSKVILIERSAEPALFDVALDWLNGNRADVPPELDMHLKLNLWSKGLLISPDELKDVPTGVQPEFSEGNGIAIGICSEVAQLLLEGPSLPTNPGKPDEDLAESGFCSVAPVISTADIAAMKAFYAALSEGEWLCQEGARGLSGIHNDPVARRIQFALAPYFSALIGHDIKPSYTYAREYSLEAPLLRHVDRKQCEYTFSLYIDYQPQPSNDLCPWPLIVHAPGGDVVTYQCLGGGLVIRGRELEHSRPPLPPDHKATMVFIHYVSKSFTDSLD
ncbi:MAG: hypothetical protein EBY21_13580 [Alphaproteobacteria bacterium]|nr:hypothetical protein [Alphaproteobacteria bacterium]